MGSDHSTAPPSLQEGVPDRHCTSSAPSSSLSRLPSSQVGKQTRESIEKGKPDRNHFSRKPLNLSPNSEVWPEEARGRISYTDTDRRSSFADSPCSGSSNRTPLFTSSSLGFRIEIFRSKTDIKLKKSTQKTGQA